ncbi:thioredoxin domain-containing protein, partial [Saprospiraceae bacterium]|nr:thioredoxin domain-containing protein [Saprospiraceae bacterium]
MNKSTEDHKYTNDLIDETSPYLLQHAHNPVNWHAWNEETLAKAKKEDKLLIVSIGYAACHWCHVMEHESFEDSTVAAIMNEFFIPIKVDREERPDVDDVYMTACQLVSGRGGWPLNAFALPDGKPIWAGTYFPQDQWLKILEQFRDLKENDY